jgi:MFS family permease
MSLASVASVLAIREQDIDHELARGSIDDSRGSAERVSDLFRDRRVILFSVSVILFHLANAAMLPLVGQKLSAAHPESAAAAMSACIVIAQLVMVPVALWASRAANTWGRKPVFLIGFAVLPLRGLLYTLTDNPYALVAIQSLDGIGAGIFGVVGVLIIADLTRGTGRFNLMQGALATALGIGAAASNVLTGLVVQAAGFNAGFAVLSTVAAIAVAFFAIWVPESKPAELPADSVLPIGPPLEAPS